MERFDKEKISSEEVGVLDNNSEWLGIPKSLLMECAGYSFATEVFERNGLGSSSGSKVAIFCGTGNNGGDGFVIARHLSSLGGNGIKILVILLGTPGKIRTPEAKLNWQIISNSLNYNITIKTVSDSSELSNIYEIIKNDANFKLIIDGLLGTGIKGEIREPISSAIDVVNKFGDEEGHRLKVVSIDVPSGLNPNTGEVPHKAVKASLVITFHRTKKGLKENSKYIGKIVVKPIGIPREASLFVGKGDLIPTLKVRKVDNHKGQFGRMLVIGGSRNYSGAPAYSSLTGSNFGIDLVITHVPEVVGDVIRGYSPNLIVRTSPGDWLNSGALNDVKALIEWSNVVLIGPGMGQEEETEELLVKVIELVKKERKALVLDADALKLVKNHLGMLKGMDIILTPHEGELKIMSDIELPSYDDVEKRGKVILELASKLDVVLLVKGPHDYISNGKKIKVTRTGCPEMSIGGPGDVLAGLCACFLATDNAPFESACSAAFLNGYIGEYCKENVGPRFTAMDMIKNINVSVQELLKLRKK